MPSPYETRRIKALKKSVAERYGAINKDEMRVLERSASSDRPDVNDSGERPEVRCEFLRFLATDPVAAGQIDPLGIQVYNATVSSFLDLNQCKIPFALEFGFCVLKEGMSLQWATLLYLYLFHCTTESAIWADGAQISGDLTLDSLGTAQTVSLVGVRISGNLVCSGATLTATGEALNADGAKIAGSVFLNAGFTSTGLIRLVDSTISGNLECAGAKLTASDNALNASTAQIAGNVFLNEGFSSTGAVNLAGAVIGGDLDFSGAILSRTGDALVASSAKTRNLFFRDKFSSLGAINLRGMEIAGDLDFQGAQQFASLQCDNMHVGGRMILLDIVSPAGGDLGLFGTNVGELHDDEKSWPQKGNLILDGLVYRSLVLHARATDDEIKQSEFGDRLRLDPLNRIRWLQRQPDSEQYNAQPWMQLAKLLETTGDTDGAKHVVYEFHRQRAQRSLWRPVSFFYDQIEEQPLRVGWPIAFFWGLGALVFWRAERMGAMRSTAVAVTNGAGAVGAAPQVSAPLHPVVYALENVLPVVKLGQDSAWEPDPNADGSLLPDWSWVGRVRRRAEQHALTRWMIRLDYKRLMLLRWALILLGWGLALILAAAIGEQFKR